MLSLSLFVGLIVIQFSEASNATVHYAVIFPSEMSSEQSELVCLQLDRMEEECRVRLSLHMATSNITLIDKTFQKNYFFSCIPFQVPFATEGSDEVALMKISIQCASVSVYRKSKLLLKKPRWETLVQTDKAFYKAGQTVKFRVLSLKENLQPGESQIPVIELQDPEKNRIGQWLNVSLKQGIAELSLPLSSEPMLGEYSVLVKDKVHTFSVEEYVLPKFDINFQLPKVVHINSESFTVSLISRYKNMKPVHGNYKITVCRKFKKSQFQRHDLCADFSGKLDRSGFTTLEIEAHIFHLMRRDMLIRLKVTAAITEEETGITLSTIRFISLTGTITRVHFIDCDSRYWAGIPYRGLLKLVDEKDTAIPGQTVLLTCYCGSHISTQTLVTDQNGRASFILDNTADWNGAVSVMAKANLAETKSSNDGHFYAIRHGLEHLLLYPSFTRNMNFLKFRSLNRVLPCAGQQEILVDYVIKHTELMKDVTHLDLHYLGISRSSIKLTGHLEIPIQNTDMDVIGEASFNLPLNVDFSPTFHIIGYILLPDGDIVADLAKLSRQRCFKNKVSFGFLSNNVLPGSNVSYQVRAAPGSLCGLRLVDKSVPLINPENELTADKVHDLFPSPKSIHSVFYDRRVVDDIECDGSNSRYRAEFSTSRGYLDVFSNFENLQLKIITNAEILKPVPCAKPDYADYLSDGESPGFQEEPKITTKIAQKKEETKDKTYSPETWIWKLEPVGDSGSAVLQDAAPHTITDWNGEAFCMGPSGVGISSAASLSVFQPFSVDLTLPYSVVRGEIFILKASVFNYLKDCIKVKTTLQPSAHLEESPCADCQYSSCLCADESKTFSWNLKASKLGEVHVTVRTEVVDTQELCHNKVPVVPKERSVDTVVKPLLVQPGGVLVEKSYSTLFCSQEEGYSKKEEILLKVPENIINDSEMAHITVTGDVMGTVLQNMDNLLARPYGCGEQNMMRFAPNIFTLEYLEKTHQLTTEVKNRAIKFLQTGYQRQLKYKLGDGSYSAFGKRDQSGNTWLTALVVKSFSNAGPYIFIDDNHLKHSLAWLKQNSKQNGCFHNVGQIINTEMKGRVEDDLSLSAYVTIALLEAGVSTKDPMIMAAVSCIRKTAVKVSSVYSQAMMAYAFTLSGNTALSKIMMNKLDENAVHGDGQLHWANKTKPQPNVSYWSRAPSTDVETTAYVLLAHLGSPTQDMGKVAKIVNWLTKQQNSYGGFFYAQDTVVALQALAKYAEVTFSDKGNMTVTINSKTEFLEQFHVDNNNRLLLQRALLPSIPGEYTVTATGSGCASAQAVLRYNVPPPTYDASFAIKVEIKQSDCTRDQVTKLDIHITAKYTGNREKSNMALIEVKMLSGYIPVKSTVKKLENSHLIQRSDIQTDMVTMYLHKIGQSSINLSFQVEQYIEVKNLKPATVKVYDYYETDELAITEYNSPCSIGNTRNSR